MVHFIGSKQSTCTQRVLTVLAEKNITDFTLHEPDFATGEHKSPAYLEKQPFGQVPVLEDGDFRLYESRAICRYLAAKHHDQGTKLIPDASDAKAVALFEQWASVELGDWDAFANPIVDQKMFNPYKGLPVVQQIVDDATAKFKGKLEAYNVILGKQKYMGGDEFSLIDIFYLPYTAKLFQIGDGALIEAFPNVKAWWELVSQRDSWKKASGAA